MCNVRLGFLGSIRGERDVKSEANKKKYDLFTAFALAINGKERLKRRESSIPFGLTTTHTHTLARYVFVWFVHSCGHHICFYSRSTTKFQTQGIHVKPKKWYNIIKCTNHTRMQRVTRAKHTRAWAGVCVYVCSGRNTWQTLYLSLVYKSWVLQHTDVRTQHSYSHTASNRSSSLRSLQRLSSINNSQALCDLFGQ